MKKTDLKQHPHYTEVDYRYLRDKGYSHQEIWAIWDRDAEQGQGPVTRYDTPPDIVGQLNRPEAKPETDALMTAIREALSPAAVAAIAACLEANRTGDAGVDREVAWLADQLVALLGGAERYDAYRNELGR